MQLLLFGIKIHLFIKHYIKIKINVYIYLSSSSLVTANFLVLFVITLSFVDKYIFNFLILKFSLLFSKKTDPRYI